MRGLQHKLWVPNNRKKEVGTRLKPIKEAERRKGTCLFVVDENGKACRNLVENNCHVISESAVLDELKDSTSGKVLELRWGVSKWEHLFVSSSEANPIDLNDSGAFEPSPVGTGDACVGWFACKSEDTDHGGEFKHIDVQVPILRILSFNSYTCIEQLFTQLISLVLADDY